MSCRIIKTSIPNFDAVRLIPIRTRRMSLVKLVITLTLLLVSRLLTLKRPTLTVLLASRLCFGRPSPWLRCRWGMKVDTVEDVRRNTNFTVASMMAGTGVLRPGCASVIYGGDLNAASTATAITKENMRTVLGMTPEYKNTAVALATTPKIGRIFWRIFLCLTSSFERGDPISAAEVAVTCKLSPWPPRAAVFFFERRFLWVI